MRTSLNPGQFILIGLLKVYRWTLSPLQHLLFGPIAGCRFTPTCSVYSIQAIRKHGAVRGGWLAAKRVCRCHPWGDCGYDPVPAEQGRQISSKFQGNPAADAVL